MMDFIKLSFIIIILLISLVLMERAQSAEHKFSFTAKYNQNDMSSPSSIPPSLLDLNRRKRRRTKSTKSRRGGKKKATRSRKSDDNVFSKVTKKRSVPPAVPTDDPTAAPSPAPTAPPSTKAPASSPSVRSSPTISPSDLPISNSGVSAAPSSRFKMIDFDNPGSRFGTDSEICEHPAILFSNCYTFTGADHPGSGYDIGTISLPNVGYNGYGKPMLMNCPGGHFSLSKICLTPAHHELTVNLDGYLNGELATYGIKIELTDMANPTCFGPEALLFDFEQIDLLLLSTSTNGDFGQVAIDDMEIKITKKCSIEAAES